MPSPPVSSRITAVGYAEAHTVADGGTHGGSRPDPRSPSRVHFSDEANEKATGQQETSARMLSDSQMMDIIEARRRRLGLASTEIANVGADKLLANFRTVVTQALGLNDCFEREEQATPVGEKCMSAKLPAEHPELHPHVHAEHPHKQHHLHVEPVHESDLPNIASWRVVPLVAPPGEMRQRSRQRFDGRESMCGSHAALDALMEDSRIFANDTSRGFRPLRTTSDLLVLRAHESEQQYIRNRIKKVPDQDEYSSLSAPTHGLHSFAASWQTRGSPRC